MNLFDYDGQELTAGEIYERLQNATILLIREQNVGRELTVQQWSETFDRAFPVLLDTFVQKLSPEVRDRFLRELEVYFRNES